MADTAELKTLLARVEEAEGADRESDALIWASTLPEHGEGFDGMGPPPEGARFEYEAYEDGAVAMWVVRDGEPLGHDRRAKRPSPHLTASIDAALALTERVLRTYSLKLVIDPSGNGAHLTWWPKGLSNAGTDEITVDGLSASSALAIIAVTLKAKIAEADSGG